MSGMRFEEGDMKQGYDKALLKRLISYTKGYIKYIVISLILLLGVIGLELYSPILIGQAVDNIIINYDRTYSIVDKSMEDAIRVKDFYLIEDEKDMYKTSLKTKIILNSSEEPTYFLLAGVTTHVLNAISDNTDVITTPNNTYSILINEQSYPVIPLNSEELSLLRRRDINRLIKTTALFALVILGSLILNYFQTILLHYTGQKIIYKIREEVFTHIQRLSLKFFNNNPVGKLVTRVTNDTETLNEMYTSVIVNSAKSVLILVGITMMMFVLHVKLTLAVLCVTPLILLITVLFRHFSKKVYREVRTRVAKINTFLSEHISGMKVVQIFCQEERKMDEFDNENSKLKKAHFKHLILFGIYRPSMYLLYVIGLGVVLGYGGWQVLNDALTLGTLVVFIQYISKFFDPIQRLAEQFNILQAAMASAEKIFALLDEKPDLKDSKYAKPLVSTQGSIEFRNVWFAYDQQEWVLKNVSFKVQPGEIVAFVGATGAGKTSILNLIGRYFEISKGTILIDGQDIKHYSIQSLRSHIGQMLQDVFIFTGDIKSNIRLNNHRISDEAIIKAAEYVNADLFIQKLPEKYDEKVYERGSTLSAGQRQLLSFARTLAFDPSILILDEATANIDTETEALIQDALYKLMKGRTTLVVAHRLSTIQHADKIVVLHKGRIKEIGNHQELLAKKGLYYQLYQLQYQE